MTNPFFEQYKDPRWQKKRLEALEDKEWMCEMCGDEEETLHVHHKKYLKGRKVWDYEIRQLAVLCESCHKSEHQDSQFNEVCSFLYMDDPACDFKFFTFLIAGAAALNIDISCTADEIAYGMGAELYAEYIKRISKKGNKSNG